MNPFDDREKAFEAKFQFDKELAFKANARRDKLLGLWVAEKLGLRGDEAEVYANKVVQVDLADARHHAMLAKLSGDLAAAGAGVSESVLHAEMNRLADVARRQIMTETV